MATAQTAEASGASCQQELPFFLDRRGDRQLDAGARRRKRRGEQIVQQQGQAKEEAKEEAEEQQEQEARRSSDLKQQVGRAKRRVLDALRRLGESKRLSQPANQEPRPRPQPPTRPADRLVQVFSESDAGQGADDAEEEEEEDEAEDDDFSYECDEAEISLGVKSDAHHAPALIHTHHGHLAEFLASMGSDQKLWPVDPADLLGADCRRGSGTAGRRYFAAAAAAASSADDEMQAVCDKCNKRGHYTSSCARTGPVCVLCANEGHVRHQCPRRLCSVCLRRGHKADKCHRLAACAGVRCNRCQRVGHMRRQCPEIWRQYHATVSGGRPKQWRPAAEQQRLEQELAERTAADEAGQLPAVADVSRMCDIAYCCNCAARGHSVHECRQPRSWLNRCFGAFHSQLVGSYDSEDPFDALQTGRQSAAADAGNSSYELASDEEDASDTPASEAEATASTPAAAEASTAAGAEAWTAAGAEAWTAGAGRPRGAAGEDFISLRPGLKQLQAAARRLLPEGSSRSQVKKLTRRLGYWSRNGYRPATPEEAAANERRMEEWVLHLADSQDYVHRLNYRNRCRLLNSTAAALQLIRGRGYGQPEQRAQQQAQQQRQQQTQQQRQQQAQQQRQQQAQQQRQQEQKLLNSVWTGRLRTRSQCSAGSSGSAEAPAELTKTNSSKQQQKQEKKKQQKKLKLLKVAKLLQRQQQQQQQQQQEGGRRRRKLLKGKTKRQKQQQGADEQEQEHQEQRQQRTMPTTKVAKRQSKKEAAVGRQKPKRRLS